MNLDKPKFYLKEYLSFTKGERVGILVLLSLIILVIFVSSIIRYLVPDQPNINVSAFKKDILVFEKASDSISVRPQQREHMANSFNKPKAYVALQTVKIELNSSDSASLDQLPGIGPVLANRIIKYRSMLGGFYSMDQLAEVYGLKTETIDKIKRYITIDTLLIERLNLNTAEFKKINAHPYITYEQTKAICRYRTHNNLLSISQLEKLQIFSSDELRKVKPYLLFSQ